MAIEEDQDRGPWSLLVDLYTCTETHFKAEPGTILRVTNSSIPLS
jgi:hypothetical protein